MKFHPVTNIIFVDEAVCMTAKPMHMPVAFRNAPVAHHNGNLMQCFRKQCPEIPVVVSTTHVGFRIALNSVVQVGELHGVAEEEYGCIVSYQIPVSFIGIKP